MKKERIELLPGYLNSDLVIKVYFKFNKAIIELVKSLPGRRWNKESQYWYIPHMQFNLKMFLEKLESRAFIDYTALKAFDNGTYVPEEDYYSPTEREDHIKKFEEFKKKVKIDLPSEYMEKLIRRRYSQNTIKIH